MIISNFDHELDKYPGREDLTWDEFVERLTTVTPVTCTLADCPRGNKCERKKGRAWSPASWPEGETRAKDTVTEVSCFVVDLDHLKPDDLEAHLGGVSTYRYALHASHSDRPEDRCVRLVFPVTRPIPGPDFSRFWTAAIGMLDLPADKHPRHGAALYFYSTRPSDMCDDVSDGLGFDRDVHDGVVLDVDAILALAAPRVERDVKPVNIPIFKGAPSEEAFTKAAELLGRAWPSEGKRHGVQLALAGALARAGWPVELIADFCVTVAEVAQPGSGEPDKRLAAARSSTDKLQAGELVGGWPKVLEEVSEDVVQVARGVLGLGLIGISDQLMEKFATRARQATDKEVEQRKRAEQQIFSALAERAVSRPVLPERTFNALPTRDDLDADLELAIVACKKSRDPDRRVDGKLIRKILKNEILSQHGDEDLRAALDRAAVAVARAFRPGATVAQVAEYLAPSASYLAPYVTEIAEFAFTQAAEAGPLVVAGQRREPNTNDAEPSDDEELRAQLEVNRFDEVKATGHNLEKIIRFSSELAGNLRFNLVTKRIEVSGGRFLNDDPNVLPVAVMSWCGSHWGMSTSSDKVGEMLLMVAKKYASYNPVVEYLDVLEWDRVFRVGGGDHLSWLTTYCGAEDTPYTRKMGAFFLLSAVARAYIPGCKVDTIMVLEGAQGAYKSTTLKTLGDPWFSDTTLNLGDKDASLTASSKWIIELPELASMTRGERNKYKAFVTSASDFIRPPYGHAHEDFLRRSIFAASVNDFYYIEDPTGNRRWWPVRISRCDVQRLKIDRDQLWAEAVARYLSAELNPDLAHSGAPGERWWFEPHEENLVSEVTEGRRMEDPWVNSIREWADRQLRPTGATRPTTQFTMAKIAEDALGLSKVETKRHVKELTEALRAAGFRCEQVSTEGKPKHMWVRAGAVMMETQSEQIATGGEVAFAGELN